MAAFMTSDPIRFAEETTESQVYWNLLFVEKTITKFILIIKEKENSEKYLFVLTSNKEKRQIFFSTTKIFCCLQKRLSFLVTALEEFTNLDQKVMGKLVAVKKIFINMKLLFIKILQKQAMAAFVGGIYETRCFENL